MDGIEDDDSLGIMIISRAYFTCSHTWLTYHSQTLLKNLNKNIKKSHPASSDFISLKIKLQSPTPYEIGRRPLSQPSICKDYQPPGYCIDCFDRHP